MFTEKKERSAVKDKEMQSVGHNERIRTKEIAWETI